jgi:hypothetical protein
MNWLYERKMKDGSSGASGASEASGPSGQSAPAGPMEPMPYLDSEMGAGFGDNYSFLNDDSSAQGNGGLRGGHTFTYLNGQDSMSIREASNFQTTSSNQKRSKKEELLDQQMEQFMKGRDMGMPKPMMRL